MVPHICNFSTCEAEADHPIPYSGQLGLEVGPCQTNRTTQEVNHMLNRVVSQWSVIIEMHQLYYSKLLCAYMISSMGRDLVFLCVLETISVWYRPGTQ